MFNRIITFLIFMLMVLAIMAQQPATGDSIAAQALDEIVVSAPKVIRKADMGCVLSVTDRSQKLKGWDAASA